jgi:hypothetical protein
MSRQFILIVVLLLTAGGTSKADQTNFGAIAFDQGTGAVGYSYNRASRQQAAVEAMQRCGVGCKVIGQFWNNCGSLAANAGGVYGWAGNGDENLATRQALAFCKQRGSGCQIKVTVCNAHASSALATPTSASSSLAGPESQWQTLVSPARAAAKLIIAGENASVALNALNTAQRSLPASTPRPIECWDMMISASSKRNTEAAFAIQRANEAVGCYELKRQIARQPAFSTSTNPNQESDEDYYTKVHPNQPRVGDVPGLPYQGSSTTERSVVNPCMTTDGHRVPNCR